MSDELQNNSQEVKKRLLKLIETMIKEMNLSPMIKSVIHMNLGSMESSINNLSDEQLDEFLNKADDMLCYVRYGECE